MSADTESAFEARAKGPVPQGATEATGIYRRIVDAVGVGLCGLDPAGRITFMNETAQRLLGYRDEEAAGKSLHDLAHPSASDDASRGGADCSLCQASQDGARHWPREHMLQRKNGTVFPVEYFCFPVFADGRRTGTVFAFRDITRHRQLEARLVRLAARDSLTGLVNREYFQRELQRELARAKEAGDQGSLLFLDLDDFKDVNDTLGHREGDNILRRVGEIIAQGRSENEVVARLGGDEFAVLLPGTDALKARHIAESILSRLREGVLHVRGHLISLRASIGIATYPRPAAEVDDVLINADLAMYTAKRSGGNRASVYAEHHNARQQAESRLEWEQNVRAALRENRFVLHWQPVLALRERKVWGYELLLRMITREGDIIGPGQFLPTVEKTPLIYEIDRWVIRQAIHSLARFPLARAGVRCLHVNLSGKAFSDSDLLPLIGRELAATGVDPSMLVLEITETAAIEDVHRARNFMDALRAVGCRFALDDFGVGFSTFASLRQLPVDYLKIDGTFIRNLTTDPVNQHLVRAIVEVARALGKRTTAEYIPDEATLRMLVEYGVDYGQGYYIGRPRPMPRLDG